MLNVEERFMIKELHRQGINISEISRRTGHDRKTIRAVINGPLTPPQKERKPRARKIDPFVPYLEERIGQGILNAQKLYQEILAKGYTGKDRAVRAFVQPYREERRRQATVRFETEPGHQAQVDWGSFGTIEYYGRQRRLYAFVMTLGWSRAMYLEFTISAEAAWWLRCHLHAFHYFDGAPREVLHDNLKTAVLTRTADGKIHWHPGYLDFAHYYGFSPRACRPYRAQTKGKVESGIKYVRGNFWPGLVYSDLADLNRQALQWLDTVANVRVHGTTQEVPFERLVKEDLQPLSGKADYDTSRISYRRSTKDCLVSYEGNYYSVPFVHAQQQLMLKETESGELFIFTLDGLEVARHFLALGRHQRVLVASHYDGLAMVSNQKKQAGAVQRPAQAHFDQVLHSPQVEERSLAHYEQWLEAVT
jgi:transposase